MPQVKDFSKNVSRPRFSINESRGQHFWGERYFSHRLRSYLGITLLIQCFGQRAKNSLELLLI